MPLPDDSRPRVDPRAEPEPADVAVREAAGAMRVAAERFSEVAERAKRRVSRSGDKFAAIRLPPPAAK